MHLLLSFFFYIFVYISEFGYSHLISTNIFLTLICFSDRRLKKVFNRKHIKKYLKKSDMTPTRLSTEENFIIRLSSIIEL